MSGFCEAKTLPRLLLAADPNAVLGKLHNIRDQADGSMIVEFSPTKPRQRYRMKRRFEVRAVNVFDFFVPELYRTRPRYDIVWTTRWRWLAELSTVGSFLPMEVVEVWK